MVGCCQAPIDFFLRGRDEKEVFGLEEPADGLLPPLVFTRSILQHTAY